MKGLMITDPGLEFASCLEVEEKIGRDPKKGDCVVEFDSELKDLCRLAYTSQSCRRVLLKVGSVEFESLEGFEEEFSSIIDDFGWSDWFEEGITFRVRCTREGKHEFSSNDAERMLGGLIVEAVEETAGFTPDVDLEKADLEIYCFIRDSNAHLGIDFGGKDLSKRDYKVYSHPTTIRGNLAYALVRMSGYDEDMCFIDPFCGSAPIPLEAAYHCTKIPVRSQGREFAFMDLLPLDEDWDSFFADINKECSLEGVDITASDHSSRNLKYGKNNAKIAGMSDYIDFRKMDVEWLDTKLDEGSVDVIVTQPPQDVKNADEEDIRKVYDELFYQCRYVLSENGCVTALLYNKALFVEMAGKHGFVLEEERVFSSGDQDYFAVRMIKEKT